MHARIQVYWCRSYIFRHLKLELLTQFPASNDEKYINVVYIWRKFVSFYGYVHWRITTEISVMYGSEKVKKWVPARSHWFQPRQKFRLQRNWLSVKSHERTVAQGTFNPILTYISDTPCSINLFTTIHDGNFRRHSSMNVTIKWHKFSSNIYYIYVFFVIWSWKLR